MAKDREMELMEDNHRVEVRVYVQKVKHLSYEHSNNIKRVHVSMVCSYVIYCFCIQHLGLLAACGMLTFIYFPVFWLCGHCVRRWFESGGLG